MSSDTARTAARTPTGAAATGDRTSLEEERDFLIRSLHDLEAERAAGDLDAADYEALRDDYTARAAALLRRLEEPAPRGDAVEEPKPRRERRARRPWARWQLATAAAIVVIAAALVGWEIGHDSSPRSAGETITGSNNHSGSLDAQAVVTLLRQAESQAATNPVAALKDYNKILAVYPDQPQALTEEGWILAQGGQVAQAETLLRQAETADATYDPAYGYLGIVLFGQADYAGAVSQLTHYLANGPDPALKTEAAKALAAAKTDEAAQRSAP